MSTLKIINCLSLSYSFKWRVIPHFCRKASLCYNFEINQFDMIWNFLLQLLIIRHLIRKLSLSLYMFQHSFNGFFDKKTVYEKQFHCGQDCILEITSLIVFLREAGISFFPENGFGYNLRRTICKLFSDPHHYDSSKEIKNKEIRYLCMKHKVTRDVVFLELLTENTVFSDLAS